MRPTAANPVERLQLKIAQDAAQQARGRYFAVRILPVLLLWALLMAAATVVAGGSDFAWRCLNHLLWRGCRVGHLAGISRPSACG